MVYLTINHDSQTRLHFTRQPGINSWGMLVGCSALGLGIGYYGNDPFYIKFIYMVLGTIIGLCCVEDWEDCDFNKEIGEINLTKTSIWDKFLNKRGEINKNHYVLAVNDVLEANVTEEKVNYFGKTYRVVLKMSAGMEVPLTESFTFGSSSEHQEIAIKIRAFLNLSEVVEHDFVDSSSSEGEDTADDFDVIDKSEILDECVESGEDKVVPEDMETKSEEADK